MNAFVPLLNGIHGGSAYPCARYPGSFSSSGLKGWPTGGFPLFFALRGDLPLPCITRNGVCLPGCKGPKIAFFPLFFCEREPHFLRLPLLLVPFEGGM